MSFLSKLVTVWLLALAIPVYGLAAATMIHCGASHQRMHDAVAPSHSHGGSHHAHDHHPATDQVATAGEAADHHHAAATDVSTEPDNFSDLAQYKCSACGACCSVAAMPGCSLSVSVPTAATHWEVVRSLARVGFFTDGPKRPPRTILA